MTALQYRKACEKLGISVRKSAKILHLSEKQVYRYVNGRAPIPKSIEISLQSMIQRGTIDV